jgi:hypothetical protein
MMMVSARARTYLKGISLIKGVDVKEGEIHIFSEVISARLGIECAALADELGARTVCVSPTS